MRTACIHLLMMAVLPLLLVSNAARAADAPEITISVRIPENLPPGRPMLLSGKLTGPTDSSNVFQFAHPELTNGRVYAQRGAGSDRVHFVCTPQNTDLSGRTISFAAAPCQAENRVTVVERDGGYEFLDGGRRYCQKLCS